MSVVRRVKPKKTIPKPAPIKVGSPIKASKTEINNIPLFKLALNKIGKSTIAAGVIGVSGSAPVKVDFKIDNNVGFRKGSGDKLELVTTKFASAREELLIRRIETAYNLYKLIDILKGDGYDIEEREMDNQHMLIGSRDDEGVEQTIEISTEIEIDPEELEKENEVTVHSINFDDHEDCEEAIEHITNELGGTIIETYPTQEYSGRSNKRKRKESQSGKDITRKDASRSARKHSN